MSLLRQGKAQLLTIYLGESDRWREMPLYVAIIQLLREEGCAGATVMRAIAGYGAGSRLHEQHMWRLSSDAPVIITVIDQSARLARVIPRIQGMMLGGLMTLQDVDVLKYTHARRQGVLTALPVRQLMETAVVTVQLDTPAATIVEMLLQAPFRVLPVVDKQQHLRGIVSIGDLIKADLLPMRRGLLRAARELDALTAQSVEALLQASRQNMRTAQDIMNPQVRTVEPEQTLRDAAQLLVETQLRNLPVIDTNGVVQGMITRADLLQALRVSPLTNVEASSSTQPLVHPLSLAGIPAHQQPISTYTDPDVVTAEEQTPLVHVIDLLITSPVKRVIVVDKERRVQGMISDVDILSHIEEDVRPRLLSALKAWARGKPQRLPTGVLTKSGKARVAADVMNSDVATILSTLPVQDAVERIMTTHHKILPVVDQADHLLGMIGRFDLLRLLIEDETRP
jgi:hypothetical protein